MPIIEGVFLHRLPKQRWMFKNDQIHMIIICPFEPIELVVQYTMVVNEQKENYDQLVNKVIAWKKLGWSSELARIFTLKDYKDGESFKLYTQRMSKPSTLHPLLKKWMTFERVDYTRMVTQTSIMDGRELDRIRNHLPKVFEYQFTSTIKWDAYNPERFNFYSDVLLGIPPVQVEVHTLIQEAKDCIISKCKQQLEDEDMTRMLTRMTPFLTPGAADDCPYVSYKDGVLTLKRELELPSIERHLCFHPISFEKMRKTSTRIQFLQADFHQIKSFIIEREFQRVIYLFQDWRSSKRSWYETFPMTNHLLVMSRVNGDVKWVKRLENGTFEIGEDNYLEDMLWRYFKPLQTLSIHEFQLIPGDVEAVFLFSNTSLKRRWVQKVDDKCGKVTTLCVVGKLSMAY
jgi:hypothetical protein